LRKANSGQFKGDDAKNNSRAADMQLRIDSMRGSDLIFSMSVTPYFCAHRKGRIINRFGSRTKPEDEEVIRVIEQDLKK
jgi:hypothetical protein